METLMHPETEGKLSVGKDIASIAASVAVVVVVALFSQISNQDALVLEMGFVREELREIGGDVKILTQKDTAQEIHDGRQDTRLDAHEFRIDRLESK